MGFFSILAFLPLTLWSGQSAYVPEIHAPLHGIYLTSQTVSSQKGEALMNEFAKLGGNLIVFDIQDANGRFAYPSNVPFSIELDNRKDQIKDLSETVRKLHEKGFYAAARFVLFKNGFLAKRRPAWTLKKRGAKSTFVNRDGPVWLDPGNPELREYLIDIGREIALSGVDEIQFDYVRFPEAGKGGYIGYTFTGDKEFTRDRALTDFVSSIAPELRYFGVKVSLDVFGILVWDNISWKIIGQNIAELAKRVDAIYPMPYPSHFGYGWGGHRNPADEPYFFVQETTKKFLEQTAGAGVKIRPWLQGFRMRATRYGPQYIQEQIRALTDIGVDEFSVWNASNEYGVTLKALK